MTESKSVRAIARTTSDRAIHTPYDDEDEYAARAQDAGREES